MQKNALADIKSHENWALEMVSTCQQALNYLLPFTENELAFLNNLLEQGEIIPSLLTSDKSLQVKISSHPGLLWKAQNVQKFKEITTI
jgi:hypothetical protein